MIPGPAMILICPYCGGTKEVMNVVSGNTRGYAQWSDTREDYPEFPQLSLVQRCPHCKKYYFTEDAKREYSQDPKSETRSFGKLGTLTFAEWKEALNQLESSSLSEEHRQMLNLQFFMAYNDEFRRNPDNSKTPSQEDQVLYHRVIQELIKDSKPTPGGKIFQAELLRETGRFDEAKEILTHLDSEDFQWIINAMLRHIEAKDTLPFLLIEDCNQVV